ncbi:hypothetical protein LWI29_030302 [Acer saccharum]|uniref:CCHC-type domain-containing protein n=1 Tax=Acer saccharum TaxID=4024 RepID=A0AA39SI83_ACESA|nr:hypothetical protein LWI29_030302 [Acer saccharum]
MGANEIQIDLSKPIKRFIKLGVNESEKAVIVSLTYERLPEFCYECGKIGHGLRECPDDKARNEALEGSSTKYGSWMRVAIGKRSRVTQERQWGKNSSDSGEYKSLSTSEGSIKETGGKSKTASNPKQTTNRVNSGASVGRELDRKGEDFLLEGVMSAQEHGGLTSPGKMMQRIEENREEGSQQGNEKTNKPGILILIL